MNARHLFASTLPLLSALIVGCNFDLQLGDSTPGVLHQASFAYSSGACLFGCTVDQPMMVGSTGSIVVTGDGLPDELRVHADPSGILAASVVRERSCCFNQGNSGTCSTIGDTDVCTGDLTTTFTLTVNLLKAGKAPLQVFDTKGALVDFVMVEAKDPAVLAVSCAPASGGADDAPLDTIRLGVGASCNLSVEARDEAGQALRATDDGFSLSIDDAKVSVLRPTFDFIELEDPNKSDVLAASSGTVLARAAGATMVNVTAGSLKRALPIEVK